MHGVFAAAPSFQRFATKKALKAQVEINPSQVILQATSVINTEYEGALHRAPVGRYDVVGPDPYTSRKWYANIFVIENGGHRTYKVT